MDTVYDIMLQAAQAASRQVPSEPTPSDTPTTGGVENFLDSLAKPYNEHTDAEGNGPQTDR